MHVSIRTHKVRSKRSAREKDLEAQQRILQAKLDDAVEQSRIDEMVKHHLNERISQLEVDLATHETERSITISTLRTSEMEMSRKAARAITSGSGSLLRLFQLGAASIPARAVAQHAGSESSQAPTRASEAASAAQGATIRSGGDGGRQPDIDGGRQHDRGNGGRGGQQQNHSAAIDRNTALLDL